MIYLDNAATTSVHPGVLAAMQPFFSATYGNPGSIHSMGRSAKQAIDTARAQAALPIGANPEHIIFTSGATESNNLALLGSAGWLCKTGKRHVILSNVEHDSVLGCAGVLSSRYGIDVSMAEAGRDGVVRPEEIRRLMRQDTGLVSVMAVNNELGTRNPIREIGALCRENGVLFHTDCVQGYCILPIDVELDCIDFLSVSGHKFHAPKGVGFLYAKRKEVLEPALIGGGQEGGLRAGTENAAGIVGLGKAAELAFSLTKAGVGPHVPMLHFFRRICQNVSGVHLNAEPYPGSRIISLRIDGVDAQTLLLMLDSRGVFVSAGSACAAHSARPSHVLKAIGLSDREAMSSIRVSASDDTTNGELDLAAKEICSAIHILRGE